MSCNVDKSESAGKETVDNGGNVPGGGDIVGGDWRTWRGYTSDYVLSDSLTVTDVLRPDKRGLLRRV
ncbi:hypothetical protein FACS1894191_2450 [Clostridia bacterium]|nr:hypothetical protein FACS1894191_2450 [Clostridia bacterium]